VLGRSVRQVARGHCWEGSGGGSLLVCGSFGRSWFEALDGLEAGSRPLAAVVAMSIRWGRDREFRWCRDRECSNGTRCHAVPEPSRARVPARSTPLIGIDRSDARNLDVGQAVDAIRNQRYPCSACLLISASTADQAVSDVRRDRLLSLGVFGTTSGRVRRALRG
jgi:hypothetical protein